MALQWSPKAPSDVAERIWTPKAGEAVSSRSLTVSTGTATLTSSIQGDEVVVLVTGGTAAATQIIAASAVLENGETITETIYLPVLETDNANAYTGQDFGSYALRKIVGAGADAEAVEMDDVLERLTDMLAAWSGQGADLGVPLPITTATVFYTSDAFAWAIKCNLIVAVFNHYGEAVPAEVVNDARRGLQQIKSALLTKKREGVGYF